MAVRKQKKTAEPQTTAQQLGSIIKSVRDIMRKDKGINGDLDRIPILVWIMFLKFLDDLEGARKTRAELKGMPFKPAIEPPSRRQTGAWPLCIFAEPAGSERWRPTRCHRNRVPRYPEPDAKRLSAEGRH